MVYGGEKIKYNEPKSVQDVKKYHPEKQDLSGFYYRCIQGREDLIVGKGTGKNGTQGKKMENQEGHEN